MFYCKACAKRKGWPTDWWISRSDGPCEICRRSATCYDVPSRWLPLPQEVEPKKKEREGHQPEEDV